MISLRSPLRRQLLLTLLVIAPFSRSVGQSCPATKKDETMPLKYVGPATKPEVTACDLMTRLYIYADDSMMGRRVGDEGNTKATAYIESEVRRMGLLPAGDNGGYFQGLPLASQQIDPTSEIVVGDRSFRLGTDFLAQRAPGFRIRQFEDMPVVYGGVALDTMNILDSATVAGKVLILRAGPPVPQQIVQTQGYQRYVRTIRAAARVVTIAGDTLATVMVRTILGSSVSQPNPAAASAPAQYPALLITTAMAEALIGMPLSQASKGTVGKSFSSRINYTETANPNGRNVVAIVPGTDPKLKGQYIAIGAHNDHIGFAPRSLGEHDSLKVWGAVAHPAGAEGGRNFATNPITAEEWTQINSSIAEMRKHYPARPDSIYNGADDDGTGSVSVLELAEAAAKGKIKPKRSLLFIWHTGEESGMWGSAYFMDHPTVPRDSIVAELNIDMVGRGAASDVTGQKKEGGILHGGDHYVQLVGSRRLSTELGDLVEKVNTDKKHNFLFDYAIDADGHPQNIYCRSDHWSYGKWGVPVVFFTTGGHADYHQVTDEPQYIRYEHMASLDNLILDLAETLANLDHRVVVDKPKPNPAPAVACRQ